MIVLDTNVVSEGLRPSPDKHVSEWLDTIELGDVRISVVTAAQMLQGVLLLPDGRRREDLQERVDAALVFYSGRLVTRNVKDFEGTGVALINPWEPA